MKEVVRSACRTALLEAGFTPDDYFYSESPVNGGETPGGASSYFMQEMDMDIYGEAPDKMTYTEQANKRAHCKRLTWYVQYYLDLCAYTQCMSYVCYILYTCQALAYSELYSS